MSLYSNTDAPASKPKLPEERQVRKTVQLTTANTTNVGASSITLSYNDGAQSNVANVGVAVGQYVYFAAGLAGNGVPNFFSSNNTVSAISGNTVTLTVNTFNTTGPNTVIEFDTTINRKKAPANTYFQDTVLITASRTANANNTLANTGNLNAGWNRVVRKVNSDGTVRLLKETLVCLANARATLLSSANTSFGNIARGL